MLISIQDVSTPELISFFEYEFQLQIKESNPHYKRKSIIKYLKKEGLIYYHHRYRSNVLKSSLSSRFKRFCEEKVTIEKSRPCYCKNSCIFQIMGHINPELRDELGEYCRRCAWRWKDKSLNLGEFYELLDKKKKRNKELSDIEKIIKKNLPKYIESL